MPALRLIFRIAPVWSFYRCFSLDTKSRYWYLKNSINRAGLRLRTLTLYTSLLEMVMLMVIKDGINLAEYGIYK